MNNSDMQMTLCLAWAVRIALLALYVPMAILSNVVESARRLDLWASAIVMQSALQIRSARTSRPERTLQGGQMIFSAGTLAR